MKRLDEFFTWLFVLGGGAMLILAILMGGCGVKYEPQQPQQPRQRCAKLCNGGPFAFTPFRTGYESGCACLVLPK